MNGIFDTIDEAFALVRRAGWGFVQRCVWADLPLAMTAVSMFYFEQIEGVRGLRGLFALLFVLSWWWRAHYASRAARMAVLAAAPNVPLDVPSVHRTIHLASFIALGLWGWAWCLSFASWAGPIGVLFVFPLMSLRGLFGPSWLARTGCREASAFAAWRASMGDSTDRRMTGLLCEALVLLGTLPVAVNVYMVVMGFVMLARSFMALDVATVSAFLSPSNSLVTGTVLVVGLVLTDVVRVSLSAVHFVESQVRNKGLDLADMMTEIETRAGRGAAALLILAVLGLVPSAHAQQTPNDPFPSNATGEVAEQPEQQPKQKWLTDEDMEVREKVSIVLRQPEFTEHQQVEQGTSIRKFLSEVWDWMVDFMSRQEKPDFKKPEGMKLPLPPAWIFVVFAAVLLLAVLGYVAYHRDFRRTVRTVMEDEEAPLKDDPRDKAPEQHLDEAAVLARDGKFREALRSLYLATLVSLDRRGTISFDPSLTNWQYLRSMPKSETRARFGDFTKMFDYKWYGDEATSARDYEESRRLAAEICKV